MIQFEEIGRLEGHQGEVWALDVGKYGNIVVSGSHDRSTRIWEKTDEQVNLSCLLLVCVIRKERRGT